MPPMKGGLRSCSSLQRQLPRLVEVSSNGWMATRSSCLVCESYTLQTMHRHAFSRCCNLSHPLPPQRIPACLGAVAPSTSRQRAGVIRELSGARGVSSSRQRPVSGGAERKPPGEELVLELAKLAESCGGGIVRRKEVNKIEAACLASVKNAAPDEIVRIYSQYGAVGMSPGKHMMSIMESKAVDGSPAWSPEQLNQVVQVYANLGIEPGSRLASAIERRAVGVADQLGPGGIVKLLRSHSVLGLGPDSALLSTLSAAVESRTREIGLGHLAAILGELSRLGHTPSGALVAALELKAAARMDSHKGQEGQAIMTPLEVADLIYSHKMLGIAPRTYLVEALKDLEGVAFGQEVAGAHAARMMWGCAKLGIDPGEWVIQQCEARVVEEPHSLTALDSSNLMWAYVTLGIAGPRTELVARLEEQIYAGVPSLGAGQLSCIYASFAGLSRMPDPDLVLAMEERCIEVMHEFGPLELTFVACAYASMGMQPCDELASSLDERATNTMGHFSAEQAGSFICAISGIGISPSRGLLERVEQLVSRQCGEFGCDGASSLLTAFANMRALPASLWKLLPALENGIVTAVEEEMNKWHASGLLHAYATLGAVPGPDLWARICGVMQHRARELDNESIANSIWGATVLASDFEHLGHDENLAGCAIVAGSGGRDGANHGDASFEVMMLALYGEAAGRMPEIDAGGTSIGGALRGDGVFEGTPGQGGGPSLLEARCALSLLVADLEMWSVRNSREVSTLRTRVRGGIGVAALSGGSRGGGGGGGGGALLWGNDVHRELASSLERLGLGPVQIDYRDPRSGYSISAVVRIGGADGAGVAIDLLGDECLLHDARGLHAGETRVKNRVLSLLGYKVVCVPVDEWMYLSEERRRDEYLDRLLQGDAVS